MSNTWTERIDFMLAILRERGVVPVEIRMGVIPYVEFNTECAETFIGLERRFRASEGPRGPQRKGLGAVTMYQGIPVSPDWRVVGIEAVLKEYRDMGRYEHGRSEAAARAEAACMGEGRGVSQPADGLPGVREGDLVRSITADEQMGPPQPGQDEPLHDMSEGEGVQQPHEGKG